jgi:hypothetical protein
MHVPAYRGLLGLMLDAIAEQAKREGKGMLPVLVVKKGDQPAQQGLLPLRGEGRPRGLQSGPPRAHPHRVRHAPMADRAPLQRGPCRSLCVPALVACGEYAHRVSTEPFSGGLDYFVPIASEPGNRAFFGRDVLQGLVDGIDDFVKERQPRWERRTHRVGAPVLLACSPWVNDDKLLLAIEDLPGACVVISKHPRTAGGQAGADRLREVNQRTNGIELRALSELAEMAPKVGGEPLVIGPYGTDGDVSLSTFRTIGYRKTGRARPPIVHAKLALLGNICWTDEHPSGHIDEYIWFSPRRLWVSSANFTYGSRSSVEFGYWTEDADLVRGVKRFLVNLIGASENLDSAADQPDPELAPVEFDNEAMAEAVAEWHQARVEDAAMRGEDLDDDGW